MYNPANSYIIWRPAPYIRSSDPTLSDKPTYKYSNLGRVLLAPDRGGIQSQSLAWRGPTSVQTGPKRPCDTNHFFSRSVYDIQTRAVFICHVHFKFCTIFVLLTLNTHTKKKLTFNSNMNVSNYECCQRASYKFCSLEMFGEQTCVLCRFQRLKVHCSSVN